MSKAITFRVTGYSGLDRWLEPFMPSKLFAKRVAKKLLKSLYKDWDPETATADLLIMLPEGTYRVLDRKGNVEPSKPDAASGPGF